MVSPVLVDSVIYASIYGLMSMGLTVTYITTKVPNFAFGSLVTIGIYVAFPFARIDGISPYETLPLAFLMGGAVSVAMYLLVLRPLAKRGSSTTSLMIATLAVDTILTGLILVFDDYLRYRYAIIDSEGFAPVGHEIQLFGLPGLFVIAPLTLALATIALWLMLTRTRLGIAIRAAVENQALARTVGVNVERVFLIAWFIAGGLAGLVGPFYAIHLGGQASTGSVIIVGIFAASVLGGITSVYGAMVGGLIVGGSEVILTTVGSQLLGSWVFTYEPGIPLLVMIATLLVLPKGLAGVNWRRLTALRGK
ncbi:MAG: branched-chain amino acid ABC transporter permease [Nitrososphaerota archaeon]|nr:branched-chain amino acid ABC transporter permease [Nitrososphaerota archaeon]